MLDMGDLRIDQQTDRRREGRALARFRQPLDPERPAGTPDLAAENPPRHLRQAGELAGAARQHNAPPGSGRETGIRQPVAYQFEDLRMRPT